MLEKIVDIKEVLDETLIHYSFNFLIKFLAENNKEFYSKIKEFVNNKDEGEDTYYIDTFSTLLTQIYLRLLIDNLTQGQSDISFILRGLGYNNKNKIGKSDTDYLIVMYEDPQQIARYLTPQNPNDIQTSVVIKIKNYVTTNLTNIKKIMNLVVKNHTTTEQVNDASPKFCVQNKFNSIVNMDKRDLDSITVVIKKKRAELPDNEVAELLDNEVAELPDNEVSAIEIKTQNLSVTSSTNKYLSNLSGYFLTGLSDFKNGKFFRKTITITEAEAAINHLVQIVNAKFNEPILSFNKEENALIIVYKNDDSKLDLAGKIEMSLNKAGVKMKTSTSSRDGSNTYKFDTASNNLQAINKACYEMVKEYERLEKSFK